MYHVIQHTNCINHTTIGLGLFSVQEISNYKSFFGQVQDLIFHPDGKLFFSAAEILKRNSLDKAITAWDYESTAIMSNQISQVKDSFVIYNSHYQLCLVMLFCSQK